MGYLGLWLTRDGVKPINRKIEAITNMAPTNYRKEVRKLIGVINYYRNMWPRQSHTLAPLTRLTPIFKKNGQNPNKMLSMKLSGLWPAIIY